MTDGAAKFITQHGHDTVEKHLVAFDAALSAAGLTWVPAAGDEVMLLNSVGVATGDRAVFGGRPFVGVRWESGRFKSDDVVMHALADLRPSEEP